VGLCFYKPGLDLVLCVYFVSHHINCCYCLCFAMYFRDCFCYIKVSSRAHCHVCVMIVLSCSAKLHQVCPVHSALADVMFMPFRIAGVHAPTFS
jgi:hypothetical protein